MSLSGSSAVLLISQVCNSLWPSLSVSLSPPVTVLFLLPPRAVFPLFSSICDESRYLGLTPLFMAFYYVLISSSPWDSLALSRHINGLYHSCLSSHPSVTPSSYASFFFHYISLKIFTCPLLCLSFRPPRSSLTSFSLWVLLWLWCSVALQSLWALEIRSCYLTHAKKKIK